jgi:prophage DNA circulation protein
VTTETDALASALGALAEAVRAAYSAPGDAIRVLSSLAAFTATSPSSTAPIGKAITATVTATAALCRRAALTSLARACAAYQPTSYDDALAVRDLAADLMDTEAETAADGGDLATFDALRALRAAVVADLTTRGAQLPRLTTFSFPQSLPVLALAYRIYGDTRRADDLMARVDPPNPAFMPWQFRALIS